MTDYREVPSGALEDVAYLSRSQNRVAILGALARGPSTRRELQETTGTSRTTLDRIVNELEDRDWAKRLPDGDYAATAAGTHLVNQFRPFVESVEAVRRLEETVSWLPTDELTIGLEHFSDATVMRPERDVVEVVEFMADLFRNSDDFRVLTHLTPPERLGRTFHESVVSGSLSVTAVVTGGTLDVVRGQPRRRERWRDMVESGSEVYRYDGSIPCNLWTFDGTVLIKKSGEEPIPESYGVPIVSENERVLEWGHRLIDRYRDDGVRLEPADFRPEREPSRPGSAED